MASMLKEIAKRSGNLVVRGSSETAWETTGRLRSQFVMTTLDAMPARLAEASAEWNALRDKLRTRNVTVNELGVLAVRGVELYASYLIGRVIGGRSL